MNAILSPSSCLFLVVVLAVSHTGTAQESEETVLLKVSGSVAERLPGDTVVTVRAAGKGRSYRSRIEEMRSMCFGCGWALGTDFSPDLPHGTELRIMVLHDTGDLFGELRTECSYTHRVPRDAEVSH